MDPVKMIPRSFLILPLAMLGSFLYPWILVPLIFALATFLRFQWPVGPEDAAFFFLFELVSLVAGIVLMRHGIK